MQLLHKFRQTYFMLEDKQIVDKVCNFWEFPSHFLPSQADVHKNKTHSEEYLSLHDNNTQGWHDPLTMSVSRLMPMTSISPKSTMAKWLFLSLMETKSSKIPLLTHLFILTCNRLNIIIKLLCFDWLTSYGGTLVFAYTENTLSYTNILR